MASGIPVDLQGAEKALPEACAFSCREAERKPKVPPARVLGHASRK